MTRHHDYLFALILALFISMWISSADAFQHVSGMVKTRHQHYHNTLILPHVSQHIHHRSSCLSVCSTLFTDTAFTFLSSTTTERISNDIISSSVSLIQEAFRWGTFGPQFLWACMIFFPTSHLTKKLMGNYMAIVAFSLIHFLIVIVSILQPDGTAPLVEFQGVFDPSPTADPQAAMMGMMKYPNFVSEEWTHVLTWDLFVGRWIWKDGMTRGIFTAHSLLLCNLIGPPGLLLHFLTCLMTRKGIPGWEEETQSHT